MMNIKTIRYYFSELVRRIRQAQFNKAVVNVLKFPKLQPKATGPLVLSMVQHKDVLPYLAALKSFAAYVDISGVVIVADKSITAYDEAILAEQIEGVIIRRANEFIRKNIPEGGCWERLIAISNYVENSFVIQLDADTLTLSKPEKVIELVNENISFTLGTYDLQAKVSVQEVARWAQSHCDAAINPHIQLLCESNLLVASGGDMRRVYIRGCAGFAGFGCKSFCEDDIRSLSVSMASALGIKWTQWGTEQFASNFIISNIGKSEVLPHPVYTTPDLINKTTVFVHFIGSLRYSKGKYLKFVNELMTSRNL
jgi:hypothetical protein